jgi:hypothetical protein
MCGDAVHVPRLEEFTMVVAPTSKTTTESIAVAVTPITNTNGKTTTENIAALKTEMPAFAQKSREQLVSNLQQGQQLFVDAVQTWVQAVSVLPVMDLPNVLGISFMPDLEAATKFTFDLAADLLSAQREFALQLVSAFAPARTS